MIFSKEIAKEKMTIGYLKMSLPKRIKYYYVAYDYLLTWNPCMYCFQTIFFLFTNSIA